MNRPCIGCGLCAGICPKDRIRMVYSAEEGCYRPSSRVDPCEASCSRCLKVCPFVPGDREAAALARERYAGVPEIRYRPDLGFFWRTFQGYSSLHRPGGASGGLLSWTLETLLESGRIDGAVCVGSDPGSPLLFDFRLAGTVREVRDCAGSCYQPVEISRVLRQIMDQDGRYAVVALPCMARGLRLAMKSDKRLQTRIAFILGLVCGQMKSRHLVDYLCWKHAADARSPSRIRFRHKRLEYPAYDFAFRFAWNETGPLDIGWVKDIGKIWEARWFTMEACDSCGDVFAECADAAYMDAWLPEYEDDPEGRSLLLVRSAALRDLLEGPSDSRLYLEEIDPEKVVLSQSGALYQKRTLRACREDGTTQRRRPDLRLEAWTLSRIRLMTRFGVPAGSILLRARIGVLSVPWLSLRLLQNILWRIRQKLRIRHVMSRGASLLKISTNLLEGRKT